MLEIEVPTHFQRFVGGDERAFFTQHWRKRVLFTAAALPELRGAYDVERFLSDYHRVNLHEATLITSVEDGRRRVMRRPSCSSEVDSALTSGSAVVLQALLLKGRLAELPRAWQWLLSLHDQLRSYLLPEFPVTAASARPVSAVDIFCATADSTTGGHYDTGDVFYFVLEGEREWTLECVPDQETAHPLMAEGTGYMQDRAPLHEHQTIRVQAGDCLYVPPYTYHRVRSAGRSLAVSLGLPAFTEVSLLAALMNQLQRESLLYEPLPTFPRSFPELAAAAASESRARMESLLVSLNQRVVKDI